MTVIAKSANRHLAAKKCCGWEEPAIYMWSCYILQHCTLLRLAHTQPDKNTYRKPHSKRIIYQGSPR